MEYRRFAIGDLFTNCYLVWSGFEAGVIDPGGPVDEVIRVITERNLQLKWIVNTHGHADHIFGNKTLRQYYNAELYIHTADREMLLSPAKNLSAVLGKSLVSLDATATLKDGDLLELGDERFLIIETPGHTPGGISLYTKGMLFSGDTLFYESIGRTDLPGGNYRQLVTSIKENLFSLPPETLVLPGHEGSTSIAHEIQHNPYIH